MFLYLCFFYFVDNISGYPVLEARSQNATSSNATLSNEETGWVQAPNRRGTFDIILSCFATLILCGWTAYHPNVHGAMSEMKIFRRRSAWMVIAMFVPELALWCAWEQWSAAKKIRKDINAIGDSAFDGTFSGIPEEYKYEECGTCQSRDKEEKEAAEAANHDPTIEMDVADSSASDAILDTQDSFQTTPQPDSSQRNSVINSQRSSLNGSRPTSEIVSSRTSSPTGSLAPPRRASTDHLTTGPPGKTPGIWQKIAQWKRRPSQKQEKPKKHWTMYHAFFAISGGFAVDTSTFSPHPKATFTRDGLLFLANLGLLPEVTYQAIADKSKADIVSKILVCFQAGWFAIQCVARFTSKLPVTILEVHVLAHVVCAFVMFLLWFNKPYAANDPVHCMDERVINLAALFSLDVGNRPPQEAREKCLNFCSQKDTLSTKQVAYAHTLPSGRPPMKHYWQRLVNYTLSTLIDPVPIYTSHPEQPEMEVTPFTDLHQERAQRAVQFLKEKGYHLEWSAYGGLYRTKESWPEIHSRECLALDFTTPFVVLIRSNLHLDNHEGDPLLDIWRGIGMKVFTVFTACYGALHLIAWGTHFPSLLEMWFWRGSALAMVAAPVLLVVGTYIGKLTKWTDVDDISMEWTCSTWWRKLPSLIIDTFSATIEVIAVLVFLCYPVARLFILVEGFISLRDPAKGVYDTVEWTQYIPHAG